MSTGPDAAHSPWESPFPSDSVGSDFSALRARPGSGFKPPVHGRSARWRRAVSWPGDLRERFVIDQQASAESASAERLLDAPSFGKQDKALGEVRAADDLNGHA